jgi:hypothetical protein
MLRDGWDTFRPQTYYLTLIIEVEAVLEQAVDEALNEFPQHGADRSRLIAHMIQALESDANWVELYSITGELDVPASDDDATLKEILTRIREVSNPSTMGVIAGCDHSVGPRKGQAWGGDELSLARDPYPG